MFQQEIVCRNCNSHVVVVTMTEEDIGFCPCCGTPVSTDSTEDEE